MHVLGWVWATNLPFLHIRPDSAPGRRQPSPQCLCREQDLALPSFFPPKASLFGQVGKVSRGDRLNVYPPSCHAALWGR